MNGVTGNWIEPFCTRVNRTYKGTHHWGSQKHTQPYIDRCAFRENFRQGLEATSLLNTGMEPAAAPRYNKLAQ